MGLSQSIPLNQRKPTPYPSQENLSNPLSDSLQHILKNFPRSLPCLKYLTPEDPKPHGLLELPSEKDIDPASLERSIYAYRYSLSSAVAYYGKYFKDNKKKLEELRRDLRDARSVCWAFCEDWLGEPYERGEEKVEMTLRMLDVDFGCAIGWVGRKMRALEKREAERAREKNGRKDEEKSPKKDDGKGKKDKEVKKDDGKSPKKTGRKGKKN